MIEVGAKVYDYTRSSIENPVRYETPVRLSAQGFLYIKNAPLLDRGFDDVSYFRIDPNAGRVWRYANKAPNSLTPRYRWTESVLKECGRKSRMMRGTHITVGPCRRVPKKIGKNIMDHRLIYAAMNGMDLDDPRMLGKDVHHINHDPLDNRIQNLRLMSRLEHQILHRGENESIQPAIKPPARPEPTLFSEGA